MRNRRPFRDASLQDVEDAVYNIGPLRHEYMKEPAGFVLELVTRLRDIDRKLREIPFFHVETPSEKGDEPESAAK